MTIEEYSYLWNETQSGWCLLKDDSGGYIIFDDVNSVMLKLDDDELRQKLCEKMLESGARIILELPPTSVEITPSDKSVEGFFKKMK